MENEGIEEECENAVFDVCEARRFYAKRCAEELGKYLDYKNNIAMEPVVLKPSVDNFDISLMPCIKEKRTSSEERENEMKKAEQLPAMINKIQELKVALKQLEDNKNFEIKHHLN